MLTRSFNTVLPLAEELSEKYLAIIPNTATILSELVSASMPIEQETGNNGVVLHNSNLSKKEDYYKTFSSHLSVITENNENPVSGYLWGNIYDQYVDKISNIINGHISYIHNTVVPHVIEFTKEAQELVESYGNDNPASQLEIVRAKLPEVISDSSFLMILEPYKLKTIVTPSNSSLNLNFKSVPEDFLSVASVSNSRLDAMIADWMKNTDSNYLETAWYSFFASGDLVRQYKGTVYNQNDLNTINAYKSLNITLAYFLLSNYYYNHLPDVNTTSSTSSIKKQIYEHLEYSGSLLTKIVSRIVSNEKNNVLVFNIDNYKKQIIVSDEVYSRWLETGGEADIILGLLVGTRQHYSVNEINKYSKELKQDWNNYVNVFLEDLEYKKAKSLRLCFLELFTKYLREDYQDDLEKSFIKQTGHQKELLQRQAEEYLNKLKKEDLINTHVIAKHLIAGIKYHFTCSESFINDMENVASQNNEVTPEEAAFIATINYIVDYLRGQLAVKNI